MRTVNEDGEVRWDTIVVYLTDAKGHTQELYSQALPLDTLQWNKASIGEILESQNVNKCLPAIWRTTEGKADKDRYVTEP